MNDKYTCIFSQVDDHSNCSFFNYQLFSDIREYITKISSILESTQNKKEKLKIAQTYLQFVRTFNTRGVQGITGILKLCVPKGNEKYSHLKGIQVVFKISINLNRSVEHENIITQGLNNLRPYCPHLIGNLGMINLPISNNYIDEPNQYDLFKSDVDYLPANILLTEYISRITFEDMCNYSDKHIISSILCQIFACLEMAQVKEKFTHYDPHLDNILIRKCDPNVFNIYIIGGNSFLIPTYGFNPILIDMGSSYSKNTTGNPMYTNSENYNNGLQPTIFDPLNDIHHLMISALYHLERKAYVWDHLCTKFQYIFRHVPITRRRGWKTLPHDIFKKVVKKIKQDCPNLNKYSCWKSFASDIIEVLNGLIILPWNSEGKMSFEDCFEDFIKELENIYKIKSLTNGYNVMYILREIVDLINKYRDEYMDNNNVIKEFSQVLRKRISFLVNNNMKEIPHDLNLERLFIASLIASDRLSSNYYHFVKDHVEIISSAYANTSIKSPIDVVKIILQNATPSTRITNDSIICVYNCDEEKKTIYDCSSLTKAELDKIDITPQLLKSKLLLEYLIKEEIRK